MTSNLDGDGNAVVGAEPEESAKNSGAEEFIMQRLHDISDFKIPLNSVDVDEDG